MSKILQFKPLKCEILLLFSALYHCMLNIFGFLNVGWIKQTIKRHQAVGTREPFHIDKNV